MSRDALQVPLRGKQLGSTGDVLLRAEVVLLLVATNGQWHMTTFRMDSGTEVTTMPAALAKQLNLPLPQQPVGGLRFTTAVGVSTDQVRSGFLRARFLGLEETEFVFPCYFVGDPDGEVAEGGGTAPRNLLGLTGVVDKLRISLDGTPAADAPHGVLLLERL